MSVRDRLDTFPAKLLKLVEHAEAKGISRFTFTHLAGDKMFVTLYADGRIEVIRFIRHMDGKDVSMFPFKLVTNKQQLRGDVQGGLASNLSELLRG